MTEKSEERILIPIHGEGGILDGPSPRAIRTQTGVLVDDQWKYAEIARDWGAMAESDIPEALHAPLDEAISCLTDVRRMEVRGVSVKDISSNWCSAGNNRETPRLESSLREESVDYETKQVEGGNGDVVEVTGKNGALEEKLEIYEAWKVRGNGGASSVRKRIGTVHGTFCDIAACKNLIDTFH